MALLASISAWNESGSDEISTGGIDTTGAGLLIVHAGTLVGTVTIIDSYSNAWVSVATASQDGGGNNVQSELFCCTNPIVGAGHTFTASSHGLEPNLNVAAFSGGPFIFDAKGVNAAGFGSGSGDQLALDYPTPGELVVSGILYYPGPTTPIAPGVTEGFAIATYCNYNALAYVLAGSAAVEPVWSWTDGPSEWTATIASFKGASAPAPSPVSKLEPHRSMYLRGFDRRGAVATIHSANATSLTVSGAWSDQADFAVCVLFDADDVYGHMYTSRYLPDFSLAGVTLDFDLAITGCQSPASTKFQSVPWGALSYIKRTVSAGVVTETPGTLALPITTTTGAVKASLTYTVNGSPVPGDRVQLVYLGNLVFDMTVPPGGLSFDFFASGTPGTPHTITIGANTYTYIEASGDTGDAVASGVAAAAASDPNASATASSNAVALTPLLNTGATVDCSASDGNGPGTLIEVTSPLGYVAGKLVDQINASGYLTATLSGTSFTVKNLTAGTDGNGVEMLEMHYSSTCYLTPAGTSKLTGGVDPTSVHVHIDFTAHSIDSLRQAWFTFAPALNYDSGDVNPALVAYAPSEFSAVFTNWTTADPDAHLALKIAGPGSVLLSSVDKAAEYAGTSWGPVAGWYITSYAQQSAHAGDLVTLNWNCQHIHNLYLGTALSTAGGTFSVSVDGGVAFKVSAYADQSSAAPISGRRLMATSLAAGAHTITLTVQSGICLFDYLQASVAADPVVPLVSFPALNCACDFDTGQTYQIPPARALWILEMAGFAGDIDFYAGVFFALKRVRNGGNFHTATVTIAGPFNTGSGLGDGDAFFFDIGGTSEGCAVYPEDTPTTLAQRLVNCVNTLFVGVCAAPTATAGQFTVTCLSPINGFTMTVSPSAGATGTIAMTGDIGVGNEGTWAVDATQASPLNRGFVDYLADFAGLVQAAGQTMTVAFSQELLAPPDANTSAGAWSQRFADGTSVLTATGFGSWGAGVVDGVSGSGPQTIEQIGHGYITGNTVHLAQGSSGAVWSVTVTDSDHYQLTTLVSGTSFTVAAGATALIDLQTSQCCFNPLTVTAYLSLCYVQAANLLNAAGLVPWLQFGEVGWWFFSEYMSEIVGYASNQSPISIGTANPHGFVTGQTAIIAGVEGNTAANGTWPIVVTDATHFTLTGSSGSGTYAAGTGTASGGGMAYYDACTAAAAVTALSRDLASFWTQDDDPTVNAGADAAFLAGLIYTHMHTIWAAVIAAQMGALAEWLLPLDVNAPAVVWTFGYPYPQGGRLNNAVNIPVQYMIPGSDIARLKLEALSWGSAYRTMDQVKAVLAYAGNPLTWPWADVAYLVPWFNGGCRWPREFQIAVGPVQLINMWAFDQFILLSWPAPPFSGHTSWASIS